MKILKKTFKIIGYSILGLFLLLITLTWAIPFFFKNDIKRLIEAEAEKAVDAEVRFDIDQFEMSILRNFPNLSIAQGGVSVVGKGEFKGDTLLSFKKLRVSLNIWNAVFGQEITVRGIYLDSPHIYAKVRKNGRPNWDIMKPQPDTAQKKEDKIQEFRVGIRWWKIDNGVVEYDDRSLGAYFRVDGLNHSGSGSFSEKVFDFDTNTEFKRTNLAYGGDKLLENKYIALDMLLNMNLPEQKYTFKRNTIKVNDFSFGFDGFLQMVKNGVNMDLTYKARETKFKNILSLIPGMFDATFSKLKTDGKLDFNGLIKGLYQYDGKKMPAFALNLNIQDGMFQYPDLPLPVRNVNCNLSIDNKNGNIDQTLIDLKKLTLNLGSNPIEARARVNGLTNMVVDALAKAQINLAEITQVFPIKGTVLKGTYNLDLLAKGIYNASNNTLPTINADMRLLNGYIKSTQYPEALEALNFIANVKNATGKVNDTYITLEDFNMVLDKEPFNMKGFVQKLDDAEYNFKVKGGIDLAKIIKVFPLEKTEMRGMVKADITTEGKASYVTKGEYAKLKTAGFVKMNDFFYKHADYLPQTFRITNTNTTFSPQSIALESMQGFVGKSDFNVTGKLSNYLEYIFVPDAILKGDLVFNSKQFDSNEWMPAPAQTPLPTTTSTASSTTMPTVSASYIVPIPENVDFRINAAVNEVLFDKFKMTNAKGLATMRDGIFRIDDVTFDMLGGAFKTTMSYNPKDQLHPKYTFDFGINNLLFKNFSEAFLTEGKGSKLAQNIVGKFNTLFKLKGELDQQMMPKYDKSMSGIFNLDLLDVVAQNMPVASILGNFINTDDLKKISLNNVLMRAEIKDGFVKYKPFDVMLNGYKMNVSGENSIVGDLNLLLKTELPANKLSFIGKTTVATMLGKSINTDNVKLNIKVGGTYLKPTTKLLDADGKEMGGVKDIVKDKVKDKIDEKKADLKDKIKDKLAEDVTPKVEAILKEARERTDKMKEEAKKHAEEMRAKADEAYNQALEDAYQRAHTEAPILKEQAGKKARQLADKIALPIRTKAYNVSENLENNVNREADKIMQEAEAKADMYRKKASE